jgi:hypothetical protein
LDRYTIRQLVAQSGPRSYYRTVLELEVSTKEEESTAKAWNKIAKQSQTHTISDGVDSRS